jgi:hypothetical protein
MKSHSLPGRALAVLLPALLALPGLAADPAPLPLLTFGPGFKGVQPTRDTRAEVRGSALRVFAGHTEPWPGITLPAPNGTWDLSKFGQVELRVKNTGRDVVAVNCRVDNAGADGTKNCVTDSVKLGAGETQSLRVSLRRASNAKHDERLFGMRGYPVTVGGAGTVDPARITQLVVFVNRPKTDHEFEISEVRATGTYVPPTAAMSDASPFFPFIDTFGQYKHRDWPGKVHSLDELKSRRDLEAKELAAHPAPADWNKFGGWTAGPQLKATGFFRTEKRDGKWWLVDPEGRLFFSTGADSVRSWHATPIDEREAWFEDFPGAKDEFKRYLGKGYALKGHYAGRSPRTFAFNAANLQRKYGEGWQDVHPGVIHDRFRSWGLNTLAMWSDSNLRLMRRTVYVDAVGSHGAKMIAGSDGYWGKFPDVFDPGFAESMRKQMNSKRDKSANDPWCLGYFSDNEMSWGDELSLAIGALKSPADQAAKKVFVDDLQARHGSIEKLNKAWGTSHASWAALLQSTNAPDKTKAREDLTAFYTKTAEQYFRTVRDAIRAVAPQQLYLGCRFAWVNDRAAAAAAKYCDVVSYNLYKRSVADFKFNGGRDVPLIIGEFHFGALDRGMFHTGLVPVASQQARADTFKSYVEGALRHPQFVGCHWFEYQDEPLTGRVYDEENYQIGFVDVTDTPYPETIAACREVTRGMYRLRSGK